MESIKNRERKSNRFTLCFKPVDMKDGGGGGTKVCADNRVSAINADDSVVVVGDDDYNDSRIVPVTSSGLSDEGVKVSVSVSDEVVVGKMKKRAKLSRIVKAVFFETSLARKMRSKKSRKNLLRSSSNISTNSDKNSNSTDDKLSPRVSSTSSDEDNNHNKNQRTNSSFSSSVTSGTTTTLGLSNSSSMALSSRSMSERKASSFRSNSIELKNKKKREDGWNYGLCLLLVSMLVLILWGKVCAIFCTSAWLFFVPRRNSIGHGSSEIGVGLPEEVDSVQYKKKVIMEGLLGRNRTRVL